MRIHTQNFAIDDDPKFLIFLRVLVFLTFPTPKNQDFQLFQNQRWKLLWCPESILGCPTMFRAARTVLKTIFLTHSGLSRGN